MSVTPITKVILPACTGYPDCHGKLHREPEDAIESTRKLDLEDNLPEFLTYASYFMANYIYKNRAVIREALNKEFTIE